MQLQRDIGIFRGIRCRRLEIDLVECQLFGAFSRDILVMNRFPAEVVPCHRVHVVACRDTVQHIGLEHRVEAHAGQADAVAGQYVRVILEMMADFCRIRVLEKSPELFQHLVAIELVRRARIVVCDRYVGGFAGCDCERQADHFGGHVIQARSLGIDSDESCLVDFMQPLVERLPVQHGFVVTVNGFCDDLGFASLLVELPQQRAQFEAAI